MSERDQIEVLANHYRERAVALFMARYNSGNLAAYGPSEEEASLKNRVAELESLEDDERTAIIAERLEGLRAAEEVVLMSEVHPSWLVDILSNESPRVVGLLLRYLPSRHSRYILEHLPRSIKDRLPNVLEAFAVPNTIMRIVRRRLEGNFFPTQHASRVENLDFEKIFALSLQDLQTLFHDLGIQELAMAFRNVGKVALRAVLNRLNFADAKSLTDRIADLDDVDSALSRDAQYSILEMALDATDPSALIQEIGIQSFTKAMRAQHIPMIELLKQKLPPHLAYLLRRDADIQIPNNHARLSRMRRDVIMTRIGVLSQKSVIDPRWFRTLPEAIQHHVTAKGSDVAVEGEQSYRGNPEAVAGLRS